MSDEPKQIETDFMDDSIDLFLRWWKSQGLETESQRSKLIAQVAFNAGRLTRSDLVAEQARKAARQIVAEFLRVPRYLADREVLLTTLEDRFVEIIIDAARNEKE